MASPDTAALAGAIAKACAFAATAPLVGHPATPRSVRAALALTLVPLLWLVTVPEAYTRSTFSAIVEDGVLGAAFGLSASAVAGAVIAAGNMIDGALGSAAFIQHAADNGPISRLYQIAFAIVFLETGGLETIIGHLAGPVSGFPNHLFTWRGLQALGDSSIHASVALAGPCLVAQALATIVAGIFARAAPQINGVLFSAPLASGTVLLALAAGATSLWPALAGVVGQAIQISRSFGR